MRQTTAVLLTMLAAAVFALWFFNTHHKVTSEQWIGLQGEARFNDFLVAQMMLEELGFEAESRATLTPTEWLPPVSDTLLIRLTPSLTIGEESESVLDWVNGGGSLVLLPPPQNAQGVDAFVAELGLELVKNEYEETDEESEADKESEADEEHEEDADSDEYHLIEYGREYDIVVIDDDANAAVIVDEGSIIVARREWGEGLITLLSDSEYFDNSYIDTMDHMRLFADVVVGEFEPGKVWLIYQAAFSPLWELIWRTAPYLVLGLMILFGLWLWAVMPAFGPRISVEEAPRRSIIEHVRAAGIFVWRHQSGESLTKSSTDLLLHEAESRHPGLGRQPKQKQAEIIARMTGMSAQKLMDVLNGQPDLRQREFTHSMQRLQSIRKEL